MTPAGRLEYENGPLTTDKVSYEYNQAGRRSKMTINQPTGSWVQDYGYDSGERLSSIQAPSGTFGYVYPNGSGTLRSSSWFWERLDLPGGHDINRSFDGLARLTQTELQDDSNTALNRHEYQFNSRHQRSRQTFLAGNYVDYTYDDNGQLTSAIGKELNQTLRLHEQLVYAYDDAWNLEQRDRNELMGSFVSNTRNQLISGDRTGTITAAGMARSSLSTIQVNGSFGEVYNDNSYAVSGLDLPDGAIDLITKGTEGDGRELHHLSFLELPTTVTYAYDANGNLNSAGDRTFVYDGENRLIRYEEPGKVQHLLTYDGFGRLRQRISSLWSSVQAGWQTAENVQFVYDGMSVVQERNAADAGSRLVSYTRGVDLSGSLGEAGGIGGLLAYTDHSTSADRTAYYHADGNGNITAMINGAGRVVARYHYDPYGNLLGMAGPLAQENRYRYSSKEIQPYTDLYYYGLRFYDSLLQRWINQDPIGEAGEINLYQSFVNDPVNWIDPFGTDNIFNPGAGQNAPPSLIGIYHPNLGGPVKIVPSNSGSDPFAGTAVGVAGGSLVVASLFTPGPEDLVMGAMTFRLLTTKCLTTKVDDIVDQIVEIEKAGGKVKVNKSGDPIIMKDGEKVRVDLKNPHGDKPYFHHERQTPSGKWKDAGEENRFYFPTK